MNASSISHEIRRDGMTRATYCTNRAQIHADSSRPPSPRSKPDELWKLVDSLLVGSQWSPEQISGHLARNTDHRVCHETVYLHIYADKARGGTLFQHLRQSHRKRKRRKNAKDMRGSLKHRVSIDERPRVVEEKTRLGDVEMDLVIGRPGGPALVTIVDRVSKFTLMALVANKEAGEVASVIHRLLKPYRGTIRTTTYDNGKEPERSGDRQPEAARRVSAANQFAYHYILNDLLGIESYFAHPYHSWERGLNENTNGLIRQYFPKKSDFSKLTPEDVSRVQNLLNSRPRKTLAYATPNDIFLTQPDVALPS